MRRSTLGNGSGLALCAPTACVGALRSDSAPVREHSYRLRPKSRWRWWCGLGRPARRKLSATLYGDHGYGRRLSVEQWSEATFEDAQAWLSNTIHPGNAVLVVAGTIDVEEAERMVRRHLGAWTGSKATVDRERGSAPIPKLEKPVVHKVVLPGASQARLDLACRLPTVRRSEPANDLLPAALSLGCPTTPRARGLSRRRACLLFCGSRA
ncbi:MAG: insulinase family protein [Myxococcales bacterium FL481]|nr:MAG: insulinase family protein [Myxococcales bacterium FL481]